MFLKEEIQSRDRSKSKIKKELIPMNLHIIDNKKVHDNINSMKKGLERNNPNVVKIFKEEISMSTMNGITNKNVGNAYGRNNKNINNLYSNYKIATKSNFYQNGNTNNTNSINNNQQSGHQRTLSHNNLNNNLFRSISPIRNNLEENNKPFKGNVTKTKLVINKNNNLINGLSVSDVSHTKSKSFNFNNVVKVDNNLGLNNYLNNNLNTNLPNVKMTKIQKNNTNEHGEKMNKFDLMNRLNSEKIDNNNINPMIHSISQNSISHRGSISTITNNLLKKDLLQNSNSSNNIINNNQSKQKSNKNIININDSNTREKEMTPNTSRKFILAKDYSERSNLGGKNIGRSVSPIEIIRNEESNHNKKGSHIAKFATVTKPGVNYEGAFKTNQDSYLIKTKIFNLDNFSVFGVFDGHGMHGHFVSNLIKLFFADYWARADLFLGKSMNANMIMNSTKRSHNKSNTNTANQSISGMKEENILEKIKEKNYSIIKNSFHLCESALSQSKYEVNFSGATSVVVMIVDDKIICANAGDSRAILVVDSNDESDGKIIALSRDHKPDIKEESIRIVKSGGRVDRYTENGVKSGPYRVWLKNENFPGLAMSRSVGDFVAESVGVICEPEIFEYDITNTNPRFIVIASDGVWEFLNNKKIAEITNWYYKNNDVNGAAEKICEESFKKWKQEDDVVDDITCIVIFFHKGI